MSWHKLTRCDCDIQCMDVWPLDKVRMPAMQAYLKLHGTGGIAIQYPVRLDSRRQTVEIRYLASMPRDVTRQWLGEVEDAIIRDGIQESLECEVWS